jgi:hypothetical protein
LSFIGTEEALKDFGEILLSTHIYYLNPPAESLELVHSGLKRWFNLTHHGQPATAAASDYSNTKCPPFGSRKPILAHT